MGGRERDRLVYCPFFDNSAGWSRRKGTCKMNEDDGDDDGEKEKRDEEQAVSWRDIGDLRL